MAQPSYSGSGEKKSFPSYNPRSIPAPTLASVKQVWFTENEYLIWELASPYKNEFRPTGQILQNGKVVTVGEMVPLRPMTVDENGVEFMCGATPTHSLLNVGIGSELHFALKGKRCQVYESQLKIKVPATGLITYPDVSVICGPLDALPEDEYFAATNPTVLVEVLSKSMEAYNRGDKWQNYQQLQSLRDYLLVSTEAIAVEHFQRQEDGSWKWELIAGPDKTLRLESIEVSIALADIYDGVDLTED